MQHWWWRKVSTASSFQMPSKGGTQDPLFRYLPALTGWWYGADARVCAALTAHRLGHSHEFLPKEWTWLSIISHDWNISSAAVQPRQLPLCAQPRVSHKTFFQTHPVPTWTAALSQKGRPACVGTQKLHLAAGDSGAWTSPRVARPVQQHQGLWSGL